VVRGDRPYGQRKVELWYRIANAASTAMKNQRWLRGGRACIDMHASCGVNLIAGTDELRWGTSLLSLQVAYPFDTYVFCERKRRLASALAERIADPNLFGFHVLDLDLGRRTSESS
jgi:hypothetical protein